MYSSKVIVGMSVTLKAPREKTLGQIKQRSFGMYASAPDTTLSRILEVYTKALPIMMLARSPSRVSTSPRGTTPHGDGRSISTVENTNDTPTFPSLAISAKPAKLHLRSRRTGRYGHKPRRSDVCFISTGHPRVSHGLISRNHRAASSLEQAVLKSMLASTSLSSRCSFKLFLRSSRSNMKEAQSRTDGSTTISSH